MGRIDSLENEMGTKRKLWGCAILYSSRVKKIEEKTVSSCGQTRLVGDVPALMGDVGPFRNVVDHDGSAYRREGTEFYTQPLSSSSSSFCCLTVADDKEGSFMPVKISLLEFLAGMHSLGKALKKNRLVSELD
ncbi:hypothetical protein Tco_0261192 [Tanacetum coccineum]